MKRLMISAAAVTSLLVLGSVASASHDFTPDRNFDDLGRSARQTSAYGSQADILLAGNCGYGRNSYYRGGGGYYLPPRRSSYYRGGYGGGAYRGGHYHHHHHRRSSYYRGGYPPYSGRGFGIHIGF